MAGDLLEFLEGPARGHPQAESGGFAGPGQGSKLFLRFDRALTSFKAVAVTKRVGDIARPNPTHIAGGAGAKSVKRTAPPVIDIMPAGQRGDMRFELACN